MKRFIILFIAVILILSGCSQQENENGQRLLISAVTDSESVINIPKEELNDNYNANLYFINVKDVTITLDNKTFPLEDAISEGRITVEEIMAYARIDARNGYCTEIAKSRNSMSHFIYRYDGICDLYFTYDVYETPDESNPVYSYFAIYDNHGADYTYKMGDAPLNKLFPEYYPADMEDWKLTFNVTDVSSTGFTLNIHQEKSPNAKKGSMHLGQLQLNSFELYNMDDLSQLYIYRFNSEECPVVAGTTQSFNINFAEAEGFPAELPSGSYKIYLCIEDEFNESDVHPLMRDYRQSQWYWISFDIP